MTYVILFTNWSTLLCMFQVNLRRHEAGQAQKYADGQQAKRAALLRVQTSGSAGSFKTFDSSHNNYLVPVIPLEFAAKQWQRSLWPKEQIPCAGATVISIQVRIWMTLSSAFGEELADTDVESKEQRIKLCAYAELCAECIILLRKVQSLNVINYHWKLLFSGFVIWMGCMMDCMTNTALSLYTGVEWFLFSSSFWLLVRPLSCGHEKILELVQCPSRLMLCSQHLLGKIEASSLPK